MKRTMRRVSSILLMCAMLCVAIPLGAVQISAASSKTQEEAATWINAKVGQYLDYDGAYGAQCVDLIYYYYNYLGEEAVGGNACDYASNALPNGWTRIPYYSGFVAQPGDIAVYTQTYLSDGSVNNYGHVALVVSGTSSNMVIVEQNYNNVSRGTKRTAAYNESWMNFYGVIRPAFADSPTLVTPTISFDKSAYTMGDTITLSWTPSPSDSNLSHYWIVVYNPDGSECFGERIDKSKTSYSFTTPGVGTYSVKLMATPLGSASGEGSLTDTKSIVVNAADTTSPVITNVEVTEVDDTGYTISCTVSDNIGVVRVEFPTWTIVDGQDDILWKKGTMSGNQATFRVNISDHNNDRGEYTTHIYGYDAAGNYGSFCNIVLSIEVPTTPRYTASFNGHVYAVYDVNSSWTTAKAYCEKMGGHLVTINSQEEQTFLEQYMGGRYYWIGASDSETEGTFQWVTGESWDYTNWNANQPNNHGGIEDYVYLLNTSKWDDEYVADYNKEYGFVLEIEPLTPVKTTVYNGHQYTFYNEPLTWTEAKVYCESVGGHLATITSAEEQTALTSAMTIDRSYWIGATDQTEEGSWEWITGETWGYANWNAGEPNDQDGCEEWGALGYEMWNDYENYLSTEPHGFICETEMSVIGDINADGVVNMRDALLLYQAVSGSATLTEAQQTVADLNGDGVINMRDALRLYKYVRGVITEL